MKKPGLSTLQHTTAQRQLSEMSNGLCRLLVQLQNAYPLGRRCPRPIAAAMRRIELIRRHLQKLRMDELETQFFTENPGATLRDLNEKD